MKNETSILNNAELETLSDDQLGAVAGGTTWRACAETEPSVIIRKPPKGDFPFLKAV